MRSKRLLDNRRRRRVPSQFSWLDHRLVRHRHIRGIEPQALALYLFLVTVGDADGISYYGDAAIAESVPALAKDALRRARTQLSERSLIAYQAPYYQVLDLHPSHFEQGPPTPERRERP